MKTVQCLIQKHLPLDTHLTISLGFLINWDKSDIVPSKELVYLGVKFNLQAGMIYMYPSQDRIHVVRLNEILWIVLADATEVYTYNWLKCLGIMASCIGIVPLALTYASHSTLPSVSV